ncbi:MAG: hypothetical protein B1H40_02580 [Candidatus Latescibacteria bacterium 4484_181]|nr:MAG: hypothetical protein B1H40_02580 [Candidatus Latescibacteria bacterium 4484_181]
MISIEALSFVYRYKDVSLTALEDIDLEIEEGESVAIMGANGSGKTTLARCINGLLLPSSGEVTVDGLCTYRSEHIPAIRRRVGMVFQNPDNQIVATTVEREIAFGLENIGIPPARMRQRVTQALRRFELEQYRHHPPHRLSGGEKQRLAIASVLAMEPKYLILDEPTSLLDPRGRREVGRIVLEGSPRTVFQHCDQIRALGLDIPLQMQLERVNNTKELDQYLGQLFNPEELGPSFSQGRAARSVKISTHNLSHIYNNGLPTHKEALSGVTMEIREGEFLALVGPIGSGKTTLAQHFNGLLKPTSGRIKIEGQDLWKKGINLQKVRQKVGLIFQFPEFQLFEEKVGEDVAFGPRNLGIAEEEVEQRVRRALEAVELDFDSFSQRSPMHLSQGEKRRVAIAGVLAMDPEVIVLDEPTVGLDLRGTKQMVRILRDLHRQGKTIVLISHNMDLVAQVSKRITVLSEGKVVLTGSLKDLFSNPGLVVSIGLELPQIIGIAKGVRMKKQSSGQLHWSSLVAN